MFDLDLLLACFYKFNIGLPTLLTHLSWISAMQEPDHDRLRAAKRAKPMSPK
jgi:hypothetical protein